jgi:iron complex outermembrane receptor protein
MLSLAGPGWAASVPDPASSGEQFASPSRIPGLSVDPATYPANVTVITAADIRRSGASTVQEIIARAEGVTLLDARGFGLESDGTLNLRGIVNSARTNALVLVDGVRQNRLTGDEVHWQSIPVEQVERIEIIRGGGGTIYGEGALAGVINIITKQDGERPIEGEEGAEIGSFGWRKAWLSGRGRMGRVRYGAGYSRRLVGGYREFSSSRNTTVTGHVGVDFAPEARLAVHLLRSDDTTNYPGSLTAAQAQERRQQAVISRVRVFEDVTDQVSVDAVFGPFNGLSWVVNGFWREWVSDQQRNGLFTITPSRGLSLRSSHEWTGGEAANRFISGVELADDKASTGTRGGTRVDESNRQGYGLYLEDTLTLWDRLSLVGGYRYDRSKFLEDIIAFDSNFNEVNYVGTLHFEGKSPKVGLTYVVVPDAATLFTNYSRPFKAPNVDDFASRSPDFQGNISLLPQQGDAYEAGFRGRVGPVGVNGSWFYTRIDNEILFVQGIPGNPFIFQNQNHDTRRTGIELAGRVELPERRVRGYATYTFVDAEFRKGDFSGNTIPGTPAHTVNVGIGVSPLNALWIDLDWQVVSDYFRINDVSNTLPAADNFNVLNLRLDYALPERGHWPRGHAYLKFQNLTNHEYVAFQSSNGHTLATGAGENPMPPFGVLGGLRVEF